MNDEAMIEELNREAAAAGEDGPAVTMTTKLGSGGIGKLALALAKAQGQMVLASKDARGNFGKYATLGAVWNACREALSANDLAVVQCPSTVGRRVTLLTMLVHGGSGELIECSVSADAKDTLPQSIGSVLTYLRRYALTAMVGVAPDDDGQAGQTGSSDNHKAPPLNNKSSRSGSTPPPARAPGSAGGNEGATVQTPPASAVAPEVPPSMVESSIAAAEAVQESDDGARAAYTKVVALIKAQPDVKERARLRGLYDASWMRRFPKRSNKHPETV